MELPVLIIWGFGQAYRKPTIQYSLSDSRYERLFQVLEELGLVVHPEHSIIDRSGFPVLLPGPEGKPIVIDLPQPAILDNLDPNEVGVAILDNLGFPARTWGLANKVALLNWKKSCLDGELRSLVEGALRGVPGCLYLDGYRFYVSGPIRSDSKEIIVMVTNAGDELYARRLASKSVKSAEILTRIGKALTMNQSLRPLCVGAVHEIASTAELAAVLLWVRTGEDPAMELVSSVGANRQGTSVLERLSLASNPSCLAELCAQAGRQVQFESVLESELTLGLEARFCYLQPGAVMVLPLRIGAQTIGVLELIGKHGDPVLRESEGLFVTVAEHLSFALNSAMLFDNVERLASYDPLTGISNHRAMQEFLHRKLSESERTLAPIGVIMIDVDHFRSFNEEEGHDAGDAVLKRVVGVLKECVRPYDLAARYGGEEFTVVLSGASHASVRSVAERIRQRIESLGFVTRSGRNRPVTVSLGCSIFPDSAEDAPGLLKAADIALFQAKRDGRNRVVFYEGKLRSDELYESIDMEKIVEWVDGSEIEAVNRFRARSEPYILHFARELGLSRSQEQILRALTTIVKTYLKAQSSPDSSLLKAMKRAEELRPLIPSLEALNERHDGKGRNGTKGDLIPLLGRILSILVAIDSENGSHLLADTGRFDPELLMIAAEPGEAA